MKRIEKLYALFAILLVSEMNKSIVGIENKKTEILRQMNDISWVYAIANASVKI